MKITKWLVARVSCLHPGASTRQKTKMSVEKLCWVYRDVLTTVRGTSPGRELRVVTAMKALACK